MPPAPFAVAPRNAHPLSGATLPRRSNCPRRLPTAPEVAGSRLRRDLSFAPRPDSLPPRRGSSIPVVQRPTPPRFLSGRDWLARPAAAARPAPRRPQRGWRLPREAQRPHRSCCSATGRQGLETAPDRSLPASAPAFRVLPSAPPRPQGPRQPWQSRLRRWPPSPGPPRRRSLSGWPQRQSPGGPWHRRLCRCAADRRPAAGWPCSSAAPDERLSAEWESSVHSPPAHEKQAPLSPACRTAQSRQRSPPRKTAEGRHKDANRGHCLSIPEVERGLSSEARHSPCVFPSALVPRSCSGPHQNISTALPRLGTSPQISPRQRVEFHRAAWPTWVERCPGN